MSFVRLAGVGIALCASLAAQAAELTVSAASSLTQSFKELAPMFERASPGHTLRLNFAASGALVQQLLHGAPVDVLATADQESMNLAQRQGLVQASSRRDFVSNTLVLVVPARAPQHPKSLSELGKASYQRIALGLPASVPLGRYTKSALESAGLWSTVEPKMIGALNARQALDYVARGEVDAGFVYASDAALMPEKVRVAFSVPTTPHIRYPISVVTSSSQATLASRFVEFLNTEPAQVVFAKHGFGRP